MSNQRTKVVVYLPSGMLCYQCQIALSTLEALALSVLRLYAPVSLTVQVLLSALCTLVTGVVDLVYAVAIEVVYTVLSTLLGLSTSCTVVFSTSPALAFDVWHY